MEKTKLQLRIKKELESGQYSSEQERILGLMLDYYQCAQESRKDLGRIINKQIRDFGRTYSRRAA